LLSVRAVCALASRDPATELAVPKSLERTYARNGSPAGETRVARNLCRKTGVAAASLHHFENRRFRAAVLYGGWENHAGIPSRGRAGPGAAPDRAEISHRTHDSQYRGAAETDRSRASLWVLV